MVALLVRLRFRVLATTLSRNVWQLVAVVVGGLQAIPILGMVALGIAVLGGSPADLVQTFLVLAGSAVVVGWAVVPMLFNGVEQTLDPVRLARFPIPPGRIMVAALLVGATWVPGATTIVAALGAALVWRDRPAAALAALPAGLFGALLAIALSRAVATLTGNLLAGRRRSIRIVAVVALALVLVGPAIVATIAGLLAPGGTGLTVAGGILAWTPYGAVWAIPGWIALGDGAAALGALVVALAGAAVIVVVWRLALVASLRYRGSGGGPVSHRTSIGWLGRLPAGPAGAIAARSLHYWFHDSRLGRQLVMLPILPILFLVWSKVTGAEALAVAGGPFTAALLPLAVFAGLSYDGTAFAAELAAGVRGQDDRIGRTAALLAIALSAVVVIELAIAAVLGLWSSLPALFGMSLGVLLSASAVVAVSSARIVIPVPRAGRNPFSASAGAGATSIAASYAVTGITAALALPELVLGAIAILIGSQVLGAVALVVGVGLGSVLLVVGVRTGGRILDARGPEVLARLRAIRV